MFGWRNTHRAHNTEEEKHQTSMCRLQKVTNIGIGSFKQSKYLCSWWAALICTFSTYGVLQITKVSLIWTTFYRALQRTVKFTYCRLRLFAVLSAHTFLQREMSLFLFSPWTPIFCGENTRKIPTLSVFNFLIDMMKYHRDYINSLMLLFASTLCKYKHMILLMIINMPTCRTELVGVY